MTQASDVHLSLRSEMKIGCYLLRGNLSTSRAVIPQLSVSRVLPYYLDHLERISLVYFRSSTSLLIRNIATVFLSSIT